MTLRLNTDLAAGLFGLIFTAVFWFSLGRLSKLSAVFPETVLALSFLISVALVGKGLLRPEVRAVFDEGDRLRIAVVTAILFAWWWAIGLLGFLVASVVAFLLLVWYLAIAQRQVGLRQLAFWAVVVVAEVAFFYLLFTRLLNIRPPRGLFF